MATSTNFIIESDAITIFGYHHRQFGEQTFTDFTGPITMPFRKAENAGAFRPE